MTQKIMTKQRVFVIVFALIGAGAGAVVGVFAAPTAQRYTASADVAMVPGPELTIMESSSMWEVLNSGQVSRTAAIVYEDPRWRTSAAKAANVPRSELTLTAGALPETSILTVTVTANSEAAAEAALSDVLTTAAPQVAAVTEPFLAKVLTPTVGAAYPLALPPRTQFAAAGALAGLLAGGGIGWYFLRRRLGPEAAEEPSGDIVHTDDVGQLDAVGRGDAVIEDHAVGQDDAVVEHDPKHRGW